MRRRMPGLAIGDPRRLAHAGRGSNADDYPRGSRRIGPAGCDWANPVLARNHRFGTSRVAGPGGFTVFQHLRSSELGLRFEQAALGGAPVLRAHLHRAADRSDRELLQREYGENTLLVAGAGRYLHRAYSLFHSLDIE